MQNKAQTSTLPSGNYDSKAQTEALYEISRRLNIARNDQEFLQVLAQPALETGANRASLLYFDLDASGQPEWLELVATWQQQGNQPLFPLGTRFHLSEHPAAHLLLDNPYQAQLITDMNSDPRVDQNTRQLFLQLGELAVVGIPLNSGGRWVGMLIFSWPQPHQFNPQETAIYHALTGLATPAVESRRLLIEKERAITETLYQISRALNVAQNAADILQAVLPPAVEAGASAAVLLYVEPGHTRSDDFSRVVATWHRDDAIVPAVSERFHLANYPFSQVLMNNPNQPNPVLVSDITTDPRLDEHTRQISAQMGVQANVTIPLMQAGHWVGLLAFGWSASHSFSERERAIYKTLPSLVGPLVENRRLVENLEQLVKERTAELRQSEARYRELVDNVHTIILKLDLAGRVIFFNQYAQHFFGYSEDEILGKHIVGHIVPEIETTGRDLRKTISDILLHTERYRTHENEIITKDGTRKWVAWTNKIIEDEAGKPVGVLSTGADITERKQAEEMLRLEKEFSERILYTVVDTIFVFDPGTDRAIRWNRAFNEISGYTDQEIESKKAPDDWYRQEDVEKAQIESRKLLRGQKSVVEMSLITKTGKLIPTEYTASMTYDAEGNPQYIIAVGRDITERKQAEAALRAAERLFSYYVDSIDAFVYIKDTQSNYTFINKKAKELFNIRREDLKKRPYTDFDFFEVQMAQTLRENDRQVMESGQPVEFEETGRPEGKQNRQLGAGYRYYLALKFPLKDEQGNVIGICGFSYEITERKRMEQALRQAKLAAETANRAKSVFLANMSHELRTPLNAILGFSQLMARDPDLTTRQQENLAIISRSGAHLLELINDVLDMSAIEAGRVTLQATCFDLPHLLAGLVEMFRLRAEGKGLTLVFDPAPDLPQYIRTDESKLRQVLINLLGNAVKFTHRGSITLHVRCIDEPPTTGDQPPAVEAQPAFVACPEGSPSSLVFTIEDTGPGIAPDELETVFDPFVQTAGGQQSEKGTGLGLSISREFVRLMGGDLTVSSILGQGSTFRFDIKIEPVDQSEIQTIQAKSGIPARRVVGLAPGQPVYRLLVAEDQVASRKLLVELLSPLGFEIQTASTGQEAVEIWAGWEPHLILMDMRMPVVDGHEATRRIKATARGQSTVIIALTASALAENRASFMASGCDDFISKPFPEAELFEKLTRHLGVRFVYEETGTTGKDRPVPQPDRYPPKISSAELDQVLAGLPAGWLENLKQATIQTDLDSILTLVEQIRQLESQDVAANVTAALADALTDLARNFEYEQISTLIQSLEHRSEDQDA